MKHFLLISLTLIMSINLKEENPYKKYTENLPFSMPEISAPKFQDLTFNIIDFGAVGDGKTLCTEAFALAIDALSKNGGGKLLVPPGVWFTGPIVLKSNINLHLEVGAVIQFSGDDARSRRRALSAEAG